ncbi:MAG: MATE family efflux transporter, partial [Actinomycetaceae bacterium]|nr:MATE family efflux transporter [Actinomycetaceae bacterium]
MEKNARDIKKVDIELRRLALPILATLMAEPLLVATDTALIGNKSTHELAALSSASTIITTLVGILIFLAYGTTATTGRLFGAKKDKEAYSKGIDGIYLALFLGTFLAIPLYIYAPFILKIFQEDTIVSSHAISYIHASAFGLPGMLVVLAAT